MAKLEIPSYEQGRTTVSHDRATSMRRDNDTVKVPKIGLFDIDFGIFHHLQEVWKPSIIQNDVSVPVPVMFATGEKWAQIRANGFIRDVSKKVQSPLMIIKRGDISDDTRIATFPGQVWGGNSTVFPSYKVVPYKNTGMQYDRVAGQFLSKESTEFYLIDVPNYVRISYDLIFWTDLQEQMNILVQGLIPMNGHMWGDFHKFRTTIQSITPDNVNVPGEDRLIKTTINLQVDGYLRNEYEYQNSKIQKAFSIKKVKFLEEGSDRILFDDINDLNNPTIENTAHISQPNLKRINRQ